MANLTKKELINILVNTYGYEEKDVKMLTNAKLKNLIDKEKEDEEKVEESKTIFQAENQKIKDDDLILVMNGLSGTLKHRSQVSGRVWEFTEFGQTAKIPYSELLTLRNVSPSVFKECWMIILNKQIQEDFQLTDIYKNILTPSNVDDIFNKNLEDIEEFVDNLPSGMKTTFFYKARELYKLGKIDSKRKIDFIESYFNISLEDNAPLTEII